MQETKHIVAQAAEKILHQVKKVIVGKDSVLLWALTAMLAGGHILLEDIPGVGKTTMALAFSKALGFQCNRMQFTPDVLPSDVTGYSVLQNGELIYKPGSVLCNLFLADELNRATSRSQSALLEAMEEKQVTVDGVSHRLPQPFVVLATQNPAGAAGTQLLPDSQVDRFMVRLSLGYPAPKDEVNMALQRQGAEPLEQVEPVLTAEQFVWLQEQVKKVFVAESVAEYTVKLMDATRRSQQLSRGGSPRATLAVLSMARAMAALRGRDYVIPRDVQEVASVTLAHRLQAAPGEEHTEAEVLDLLLSKIPAPKLR